jgi:hypothetical protein
VISLSLLWRPKRNQMTLNEQQFPEETWQRQHSRLVHPNRVKKGAEQVQA